jgi:serine/threonine-protein kinase RsbW
MSRHEPTRIPSANPAEHHYVLPAEPEAIEIALEEMMRLVEQNEVSCGDPSEIRLAMREALNNALRHGNKMDPSKKIHLSYGCDAQQGLWVKIRDEGTGFNPDTVPDPTQPENLDRTGGRGVFLMRNLMDEVEFRDGGREVHMRRRPRS